jgi:DNA-binding transcriptional ArsR family regulator
MMSGKDQRLRLKAEVFKAMGHPLRLGVIEYLRDGEKCVCDIVGHLGTGMSNISKTCPCSRRPASSRTGETA